jgi:general transcription factor 3C polypeptide 3 (transcription factor C subunit 4)
MERVTTTKAFQGLNFDEWYSVVVMYAVALSRRGRLVEANNVLNNMFESQMFVGDDIRKWRLCLIMLSIALHSKDFTRVDTLCRFLMNQQLLQNDPYRLYCAVLQGYGVGWKLTFFSRGDESVGVFAQAANQKYFMRAIKTSEALVKKGGTAPHPAPVLYTLYGHMLLAARSYAKAVGFYARAHVAAPKDPLIAFSCGLAYLNRAMNRQTENRHLQIMQAFAYLFKYYDLRNGNQEACYNIGRAFHQLGLLDLAIPYYEAGLAMPSAQAMSESERDGDVILDSDSIEHDEWSDLSRDIAYNLAGIYMSTGAVGLADILSRRFLTI